MLNDSIMDTNANKEQQQDKKTKTILGMKLWLFILLMIGVATLLGGLGYVYINRKKKNGVQNGPLSPINQNAMNAINRYDSSINHYNQSEE